MRVKVIGEYFMASRVSCLFLCVVLIVCGRRDLRLWSGIVFYSRSNILLWSGLVRYCTIRVIRPTLRLREGLSVVGVVLDRSLLGI